MIKNKPINISVLLICYKETKLLLRAFQSLERQTVKSFEIILINDCSPNPETNRICNELATKPRVLYHRNPENVGLSGSRNKGFELAKYGLVLPLDADDTLPVNTIEKVYNLYLRYSDLDYIFGNYNIIEEKKNIITLVSTANLSDKNGFLNPHELGKKWILMGTSPCSKELWKKIGGYDQHFSNSIQDQDFWQRAILANAKGLYLNEIIYNWHKYPSTMSSSTPFKDYIFIVQKNKLYHITYNRKVKNYGYYPLITYLFMKYWLKRICGLLK